MFALSQTRSIRPLALIAAVAMTCLQGAAFASVPMEATNRTVQVSTAGLNLANPAHVAELDTRIARAADAVCKPLDFRDLKAMANRASCKRAAVASANSKRDILVARAQAEQLASRSQPEGETN